MTLSKDSLLKQMGLLVKLHMHLSHFKHLVYCKEINYMLLHHFYFRLLMFSFCLGIRWEWGGSLGLLPGFLVVHFIFFKKGDAVFWFILYYLCYLLCLCYVYLFIIVPKNKKNNKKQKYKNLSIFTHVLCEFFIYLFIFCCP